MEIAASVIDPRDAHIANLEAQCAALQNELQGLRRRVDPSVTLLPPERAGSGSALLEVYWRTPEEEGYSESRRFQAMIPQGGFVSTRYVELPGNAVGHLRIDLGNQPGMWFFEKITMHNVVKQGVLETAAAAIWDPLNGFTGLRVFSGAIVLADTHPARRPLFKIITWDRDPQLRLAIPANPECRHRVLTLSCAALDPAHALMAQHGQQLFEQIKQLKQASGAE